MATPHTASRVEHRAGPTRFACAKFEVTYSKIRAQVLLRLPAHRLPIPHSRRNWVRTSTGRLQGSGVAHASFLPDEKIISKGSGVLDRISSAILALHRASRERPVEAFQDAAFEEVKALVPFDSAGWMTGGLAAGGTDTVFNTLHLHKQPLKLIEDWRRINDRTVFFQKVFGSPGVTFHGVVARDMGPELVAHCGRYGVEHILATAHVDPVTGLNETISLWRADADNAFTEEERRIQQALAPHLVETWRNARILKLTRAGLAADTSMPRSGAADSRGIVHLIDPGLTRLLRDEWPDWLGPRLPVELVAAIKSGRQRFVGNKIVVAISSLHNQLLLHGREKSVADTLSQSKLAVALHFANGRSHKEIAQLLGLAPATVRNYLASVYLKLGVASKTELANMLRHLA